MIAFLLVIDFLVFITLLAHHKVRHWDKNFAPYFTLWDRVFGTFYGGYDEYPPTGIPHLCFPCEQDRINATRSWRSGSSSSTHSGCCVAINR